MAEEGLSSLVNQVRKYTEFSRRLLRRWWVIGLITGLGMGGSVAVALTLTHIYESRTLIAWKEGVAQSRIFTGDESDTRQENWLQPRIEQMVSSHTRLWKLAQELGLFEKERKSLAPEVVLELLRKSIKFDTVGSDSFWIAFEYPDPLKAQAATERLAREFIAQNVGDKVKIATLTQAFMEAEVNKVKSTLDGIESELAQFVADHPEFQIDPATGLPRGNMGRRNSSSAASAARYASVRNPELRKALARKGQLEAQIQLATNPQGDARYNQARQDLANAQRMLATKRRQYTDQHPDVQRARSYVLQMQMQLKQAEGESKASGVSVQRLRDELAELDHTIARLSRVQAPKPEGGAPQPKPKVEEGGGLSETAKMEKRWYQLNRDREINKGRFDQLFERLTKARVTAALETRRAETQFTVVDPANLPGKPIRPSRSKLVMAGTALGFLLGLGLAALLVILDPRIYNEDDLRRVSDLPILAQVPKEA
jgi:uncharacterized protein involved in exopolysaccharide biosynthesis